MLSLFYHLMVLPVGTSARCPTLTLRFFFFFFFFFFRNRRCWFGTAAVGRLRFARRVAQATCRICRIYRGAQDQNHHQDDPRDQNDRRLRSLVIIVFDVPATCTLTGAEAAPKN